MQPSYKNGDLVIVWKYGKVRPGNVIVFKKNALTMIKRVQKIENNRYYVRGDNYQESSDSEAFGTIQKSKIIGKVILKY